MSDRVTGPFVFPKSIETKEFYWEMIQIFIIPVVCYLHQNIRQSLLVLSRLVSLSEYASEHFSASR